MMATRPVRPTLVLAAALAAGCASSPPVPSGERRAVNDPGAVAMLASAQQEALATDYDQAKREARARLFETRRFNREPDPETLGELPGTGVVLRTVSVPFGFNSTRFIPTAEQALRIRELFAMAERIEVRGRTDGIGSRAADERVAHERAEAAKRYLIDRGVPGRLISVGYTSGGDYVGDNATRMGRRANRRVDIEFHLLDEPPQAAELATSWQEVRS